jgi:hypothetical protein
VFWIISVMLILLLLVGMSSITNKEKRYECISCKHIFNDSEKILISTYNYGDEPIIVDACPKCKSDIIFETE